MGYTSVFEAMSADDAQVDTLRALQTLDQAGGLPLRVSTSFCYRGETVIDAETVIELMQRNRKMYSSKNIRHETLKIFMDGTVEEHTALLHEPYADEASNYGSDIMKSSELKQAVRLAVDEGFSVHIHAIGDLAVTKALDVLCEHTDSQGTRTIAHNQLYRSEDIARMIDAGDIFFQTTPHWMKGDASTLQYLGRERFEHQFPVGSMQRGGVAVAFGSDSCLEPETANAFLGMFYACARGDESACKEECLPPRSECISRMESLSAYTIHGARQLALDQETGSITAGKSADFVVIDRDMIRCTLQELKETQVLQTWFSGKRIWFKNIQEGKTV